MQPKLPGDWQAILGSHLESDWFQSLWSFVRAEREAGPVFPPEQEVFNAFALAPYANVKLVLIGQDPYHDDGQAHGLCFSVKRGITPPPSLKNMFKELKTDLGIEPPDHGNLEAWARQGVLLLNATLTVRAKSPGSHQHKGWEQFTDAVIKTLSDEREHLVFMLWGKYAQEKGSIADFTRHLVLTAAHPSPYAAHNGFFGSHHFSQANEYLKKYNPPPIEW